MPRVLDPSLGIVFCEGSPSGVDGLLLGHILPLGRLHIRPVGGKRGMLAFIEGFLGSYPRRQPGYLGFRERDFDVEPPELARLTRLHGEKPVWLSYRTVIENYFVDADLISEYWTAQQATAAWRHGPVPSKGDIERHIMESARELIGYQSVRWALARLKPGPRWPEIHTTWTRHGSGHLPACLAFSNCLHRAGELVTAFQEQVGGVGSDQLQEYAHEYQERFSQDSFLSEHKHLVWFHGKDHLAQLCQYLVPNFPRRHYVNWAAEHVDVGKHPDLQELVALAREVA